MSATGDTAESPSKNDQHQAIHNDIPQPKEFPGGEQKKLPQQPTISESCVKSTSDHSEYENTEGRHGSRGREKGTKTLGNSTNSRNARRRSSSESSSPAKNTRSQTKWRSDLTFADTDDEDHSWSFRDLKEYREDYPRKSVTKSRTNYEFYSNKIRSDPDGDYIDNIHKHWAGNHRKLEYHHGFIQWLFPIQEAGLNWSADPLEKHEIQLMKDDPQIMIRIMKSYEIMLNFYGFELADKKTGRLQRARNYDESFHNLNTSAHNYLRITRILKFLGEFDLEHLKFGFLAGVLREAIYERTLKNCLRSCHDYWIRTLFDQRDRHAIRTYALDLIAAREPGGSIPTFPKRPENPCIGRSEHSRRSKTRSGGSQ